MITDLLNPLATDLITADLAVCEEHLATDLGNLLTQSRHLGWNVRDAWEHVTQQTVEQRDVFSNQLRHHRLHH